MNLPDNLPQVEYFDFESDFMEDNIRCIPMIVRFKLDVSGIKLKLKEWSKMNLEERENLAKLPMSSPDHISAYRNYLVQVIARHTREKPTPLSIDQQNLAWIDSNQIPPLVHDKLQSLNKDITAEQWKSLSILKRYALMKLSRPGHENKNFPKALREFGLA